MISSKLKDYLDSAGVPYTAHPHQRAYTSQEIAEAAHVHGRELIKSVIVKTDDDRLVMAVLSANDTANLDQLRDAIGCGKLRLASEAEFANAFSTCEPGAMPPFGNIFNLLTYCDADLGRNREIEFNAGSHDETIRMHFEDYKQLVNPKMARFAQPYRMGVQRVAA